jgi:hypothetical protein
LFSITVTGVARAGQEDTCAQAYETAQELRADGLLRAARDVLRMCVRKSCQPFIRDDCSKWLNEVESGLPSVVFAVRLANEDLETVSVLCDDELLTERLDGRAIPLDPGKHSCRFEAPRAQPARMDLFIIEGQKNRVVQIELAAASSAPPAALAGAPGSDRGPRRGLGQLRHPRLTLALAGTALAGAATFVGLGLRGLNMERELAGSCAPECSRQDVRIVRTQYVVADVALGVGLAAAAGAVYLFFSRNRPGDAAAPEQTGPLVSALPLPGGGTVAVTSLF